MPSPRLFDQHVIRQTQSLDGVWELWFPKQGTQIEPQKWADGVCETLLMPGVWEQLPAYKTYRGQAVARRLFTAKKSSPARIVFKGVSHTCRILLDGKEIGFHHNAFTPFTLDIPDLTAGEHELLVHISNEHGEISALHIPNDYYDYGGINRPAELQYLRNPAFIEWVHVTPRRVGGRWSANLVAKLRTLGDTTTADLVLKLAGEETTLSGVSIVPKGGTVEADMTFPDVTSWNPDHPQLYFVEAELRVGGDVVDDWRDRIGFRTTEVDGEKILLNGQPVFVMGFNRHEDHPDWGNAIPYEQIWKDIMLFRDMGANALRTCHYPNDERMLDLCDELGILVWEENHARGLFEEAKIKHPKFREQCEKVNEEMVTEHFNRPCIIMWGILNECASHTEYGRERYKEQFEQIKALDPSRPTTYASFRYDDDVCQDLPDIAGWNRYTEWYKRDGTVEDDINALIERNETRGMKDKPLIMSEFGGGALPGFHDPVRQALWSEERQDIVLQKNLEVYMNHPRNSGVFIWQFCDCRVDEGFAMGRPRTYNNKGIVDEYRRPKLAYGTVQKFFREKVKSIRYGE